MANIDCQAAFNQEMNALNEISKTSKDILEFLKNPQASKPDTLEAKIDETNRLLKLLCVGILGKDKE
jgi:hypothetical protein